MRRLLQSVGIVVLIGGAVACTQNAADVGVTKNESLVANCQKVGDVSTGSSTSDDDVNIALANQARAKGANYVLIPSDGARSGSAYNCPAPGTAAQ